MTTGAKVMWSVLKKTLKVLKTMALLAAWGEALLYGMYLFLFAATFPLLFRTEALRNPPSRVFLVANLLMFILISMHAAASISLVITAFAQSDSENLPKVFNSLFRSRVAYMGAIVGAIVVWVADFVVIYRCFLLWQRRYRVVVVPALLFLAGICSHSENLYWLSHVKNTFLVILRSRPTILLPYSIYFAQNACTTGLIVFRIWSEFRRARILAHRRRIESLHTPNVVSIMRIIVESAMIHTVTLLVNMVLICLDHPARWPAYCYQVPITGIAFLLMAVRMHAVCEKAKVVPETPSLMPTWLVGTNEY